MKIELIYASDCPNVNATRNLLRQALEEEHLLPGWGEWDRAAKDARSYARKYGSPTILIDGRDVAGMEDSAGANCCRVYSDEGGLRGVPSIKMLRASIRDAVTRSRRGRAVQATALAGGGLVSLCCGVPLLFAFLGIAGAGVASVPGKFQWLFTGLGVVMLMAGWTIFLNEWRKARRAQGVLTNRRATMASLGLGSVLVLLFIGMTIYSRIKADIPSKVAVQGEKILVVKLTGMTCATCEIHLEKTVSKLKGVRNVSASARRGEARIIFRPTATTRNKVLEAVRKTGYRITTSSITGGT